MTTRFNLTSQRPSPLERAFALAASGEYRTKGQIAQVLGKEGYSNDDLRQLYGESLSRQLRDICRTARPTADGPSPAPPSRDAVLPERTAA